MTQPKKPPFRKGEWIRLRRMDEETRGLPNWHRAVADPVPSNLYESGWYYQPRRGQERWCAGFWRRLSAKEMRAEAMRRQEDVKSLLAAAAGATEWKPIATAPKNGTGIQAWCPGYGVRELFWSEIEDQTGWRLVGAPQEGPYEPTHYRDLPPGPA